MKHAKNRWSKVKRFRTWTTGAESLIELIHRQSPSNRHRASTSSFVVRVIKMIELEEKTKITRICAQPISALLHFVNRLSFLSKNTASDTSLWKLFSNVDKSLDYRRLITFRLTSRIVNRAKCRGIRKCDSTRTAGGKSLLWQSRIATSTLRSKGRKGRRA